MFAPYKTETPDAPVKADPFSLDALIAWLRTKPGDEAYDFFSTNNCLLGQYTVEAGGRRVPSYFTDHETKLATYVVSGVSIPTCSDPTGPLMTIAGAGPWTFGAALDRALAIRARQS